MQQDKKECEKTILRRSYEKRFLKTNQYGYKNASLVVLAFFIVVASSQICPPLCVIGRKISKKM